MQISVNQPYPELCCYYLAGFHNRFFPSLPTTFSGIGGIAHRDPWRYGVVLLVFRDPIAWKQSVPSSLPFLWIIWRMFSLASTKLLGDDGIIRFWCLWNSCVRVGYPKLKGTIHVLAEFYLPPQKTNKETTKKTTCEHYLIKALNSLRRKMSSCQKYFSMHCRDFGNMLW